jgi:hypothetical protein
MNEHNLLVFGREEKACCLMPSLKIRPQLNWMITLGRYIWLCYD